MADPATISAAAEAVNAATPFVANALKGLFGVTSAEEEERKRILESMAPYMRVAQGGTTQGQAGLSYARGRAAQELQGQAARGTAQQQAGLQREAMRVGQDVGAQYASQLADLRAREQERAMEGVAVGQRALSRVAAEEAKRKREELAGFVKAIGGKLGASLVTKPGDEKTSPGASVPELPAPTGRVSPLTAARRAERAAYNEANTKYSEEFAGFMGRGTPTAKAPAAVVRDVGERGTPVPEVDNLAATLRKAAPAPETLASSAFVAPEPPKDSIYGGLDLGSVGGLGAAQGPSMAPAPIAMTTSPFAALRPGSSPMPKLSPGSNVTPTRRRAITAPKQRKKPINLGDNFIEEVDSPTYLTGRSPATYRSR